MFLHSSIVCVHSIASSPLLSCLSLIVEINNNNQKKERRRRLGGGVHTHTITVAVTSRFPYRECVSVSLLPLSLLSTTIPNIIKYTRETPFPTPREILERENECEHTYTLSSLKVSPLSITARFSLQEMYNRGGGVLDISWFPTYINRGN
jgi:hypothetical protein